MGFDDRNLEKRQVAALERIAAEVALIRTALQALVDTGGLQQELAGARKALAAAVAAAQQQEQKP